MFIKPFLLLLLSFDIYHPIYKLFPRKNLEQLLKMRNLFAAGPHDSYLKLMLLNLIVFVNLNTHNLHASLWLKGLKCSILLEMW